MRPISSPMAAGLVIGHRRLPATEGKSVRGIFFAAARRVVDAVRVTNWLAMMIATRPFWNRA